ncbi:MAG: FKBP-type peptidyl-prolyl cis-trans isomerase [Candidatus Staskawiczbacteria bacterium]|nr:FKBP-type peptidyl-prolyl cis-trans isomerase [Candidatus Staskawiczbacteria bacterium]
MNKTPVIVLSVVVLLLIIGIGYVFYFASTQGQQNTAQNNMSQNNNPNSFEIQGMKVEILKQGTGNPAKAGDNVTVNYTGTLQDGTKFDSSLNPGRTPFQFVLGQNRVIQGWELGVAGMKVGEKRKLTIPPELAYGPAGAGGLIGPNATLNFEVDLLAIN